MGFLTTALGFPPAPAPPLPGTGSPLGRFADVITAAVSLLVVAAAISSHLGIVGAPDTFIDTVALVAVGVIFGRAGGIAAGQAYGQPLTPAAAGAIALVNANTSALVTRAELNTAVGEAAHRRLDALGAPAAPVDHSPAIAGDPANGTLPPLP